MKDILDKQDLPNYLYYCLDGHSLPHCVDWVLMFVKGSISPEFGRQGMNIALMGNAAIFGISRLLMRQDVMDPQLE